MRRALAILLLLAIFANFAEGLYTPVYAAFVEEVGGGLGDAGVSWAANMVVYGLLAMVFSRLEVKREAKFLSLGYFLGLLATAVLAIADSPWYLYLAQMLRGVSWALIAPAWDAYFTFFVDKRRATIEWGYYEGGWSIALGIGAAIGGILAATVGFKPLFVLSSIVIFLALLVSVFMRGELS